MIQLVLHLFGDYVTQSDWMANTKNKQSWPCFCHCFLYTLPFLFVTRNDIALTLIFSTHFLIDRFGLARYLVWAKNWMSPQGYAPWSRCTVTGYIDHTVDPTDMWSVQQRPPWMRVWLFIVADNALHLACNAITLHYLP